MSMPSEPRDGVERCPRPRAAEGREAIDDRDGHGHDHEHERARRYTQALVDASLAALRARLQPQSPADDSLAVRFGLRTRPAFWLDGIVEPDLLERLVPHWAEGKPAGVVRG